MGAHQGIPGSFTDFVKKASGEPPHTLYTYAEVAAALKVSVQTVEVWVKKGRIPSPVYVGYTARFDMDSLVKMLRGVGKDQTYPVSDSPKAAAIRKGIHMKRETQKRKARKAMVPVKRPSNTRKPTQRKASKKAGVT